MNLEDDIVPVKNFVREAFAYVKVREEAHEDWSSLQVWAFEIPDSSYVRLLASRTYWKYFLFTFFSTKMPKRLLNSLYNAMVYYILFIALKNILRLVSLF